MHPIHAQESVLAFNWVLNNLLKPTDELHLVHVVPDIFHTPASGSIYFVESPDPETERLLVCWWLAAVRSVGS